MSFVSLLFINRVESVHKNTCLQQAPIDTHRLQQWWKIVSIEVKTHKHWRTGRQQPFLVHLASSIKHDILDEGNTFLSLQIKLCKQWRTFYIPKGILYFLVSRSPRFLAIWISNFHCSLQSLHRSLHNRGAPLQITSSPSPRPPDLWTLPVDIK